VYNWLSLDRRGNWLIKGDRIGNGAVVEFIGRNYEPEKNGRWFFQNGPQRVFVGLAYTPLVYRLEPGERIVAHTGTPAGELAAAFMDERGDVLLETDLGIGLVQDRDLPLLLERLVTPAGTTADDATLDGLLSGADAGGLSLRLGQRALPLNRIASAEVSQRFRFDPNPQPAPGEPDC
jgi:hypothetical protein